MNCQGFNLAKIGTRNSKQTMQTRSRVARLEDTSEVVNVVNLAYRGDKGWTNEHALLQGPRIEDSNLAKLISDSSLQTTTIILVMEDLSTHQIIGSVCLERSTKDPAIILLGMFCIHPESQNKQLGTMLLEASEGWIQSHWDGANVVEIGVIQQRTELIAWYERRGFKRTGTFEPFPYGDASVGKPLRDDMQFVVMRKSLC